MQVLLLPCGTLDGVVHAAVSVLMSLGIARCSPQAVLVRFAGWCMCVWRCVRLACASQLAARQPPLW
jgi:hypothetical protein